MKQFILFNLICVFTHISFAKSIENSIEILKTNSENSQSNYEQFKKNAEISLNNLKESQRAIAELKQLERTLLTNKNNVEKNKAQLDRMKIEVGHFKGIESNELKKEEAAIEQVKAILQKLEANRQKRLENLSAYDQKITELDVEKQNWDAQKNIMGELQGQIKVKLAEAEKEKTQWMNKEKAYSIEAKRWEKQAATSASQHLKFKHLEAR